MKIKISFFSKIFFLACLFCSSNLLAMKKPKMPDEEKRLAKKLSLAIDYDNLNKFRTVLEEVKSKYPELITSSTSPNFGRGTNFLGFAAKQSENNVKNILPMIALIIEAGADANSPNSLALHRAAGCGSLNVARYLIEKANANVNLADKYGWTPLHDAAHTGKLNMVRYLVEKANANIRLVTNEGKTPEQLAKESHFNEIANYLADRAANPIKVSNLIIFIDHNGEIDKPSAISLDLKEAIIEKTAPCLIFGKHLLNNVKESVDSEFEILDFFYKELEVLLVIPKKYASIWLEENINNLQTKSNEEIEKILKALGFSWKKENFKKTEKAPGTLSALSFEKFSKLIPEVFNNLLNNSQKCIYMTGHGRSIGGESTYGDITAKDTIANLFIPDALKLFSILDKKNTQLIYVNTCFLGGENLLVVQDMLNTNIRFIEKVKFPFETKIYAYKDKPKEPSKMIFISGATTQAPTGQSPCSFNNFFKEFRVYLNKEEKLKNLLKETPKNLPEIRTLTKEIGSLKATRKYIAQNITSWLTHYSYASNIPQIRFPGAGTKFYSLASAVIDEIALGVKHGVTFKDMTPPTKEPFKFYNEPVLVINLPEIDVAVEIYGQIPLLISGIGLRNFSFENITIKDLECNLHQFMVKAIKGEFKFSTGKSLFDDMPYTEAFSIKKLVLTKDTECVDKGIKLPKILENVVIRRASKLYTAEFKAYNEKIKDYESYKYAVEEEEDVITAESENLLRDAITTGDMQKFNNALNKIKNFNSPHIIINAPIPGLDNRSTTYLIMAVEKNNEKMVEALVNSGANVNEKDSFGDTPLHAAAAAGNLNITKYLIEKKAYVDAHDHSHTTPLITAISNKHPNIVKYLCENNANVNKPDNDGLTPLHHAAADGNLEIIKYLVEDAKADITLKDNDEKTPEQFANKISVKEYLHSKAIKK
jgi:ankyrin repeat protein